MLRQSDTGKGLAQLQSAGSESRTKFATSAYPRHRGKPYRAAVWVDLGIPIFIAQGIPEAAICRDADSHLPPNLSKRVTWLSSAAPSGQKMGTNSLPSSKPTTASPKLTCAAIRAAIREWISCPRSGSSIRTRSDLHAQPTDVKSPFAAAAHAPHPAIQAHSVDGGVLAAVRLLGREGGLGAVDPQAESHCARQQVRKEQHLRAAEPHSETTAGSGPPPGL